MVNTMADLRQEVASRMRHSLHGREIDMMENVKPTLPHMLGVTPIGKVHDPNNEEFTILDSRHQIWQDYVDDVKTKRQVTEKIETAIRSLKEDGTFRMTYPYGEEAEVVYIEVDELDTARLPLAPSCADCGAEANAVPSVETKGSAYVLGLEIWCDSCGFSGLYESKMVRA